MPFLFRCQECARLKRKHLKQIIKWAWTRCGFSSNTAGFGVIKSPRWLSWGVVTNGYRYAGSCQGNKKIKAKLMRLLKGQELGSNANQSWAVCFSCLQHSFLNWSIYKHVLQKHIEPKCLIFDSFPNLLSFPSLSNITGSQFYCSTAKRFWPFPNRSFSLWSQIFKFAKLCTPNPLVNWFRCGRK